MKKGRSMAASRKEAAAAKAGRDKKYARAFSRLQARPPALLAAGEDAWMGSEHGLWW